MICKSAETKTDCDVQRYLETVRNGQFYESMGTEIHALLNKSYFKRKDLKAIIFQMLFTDNRFIGQIEAAPKRIFKMLYPAVYSLFSEIKRGDKTRLPRLLQMIESYLMLLVIAKRIANERPQLPIFTIHDSIVTTNGNEGYVQQIISEETMRAIGFAPQLSIDHWDIKNLELKKGEAFADSPKLISQLGFSGNQKKAI